MVENPLLRLGGANKVREAEERERESEKEGSAGGLASAREGERGRERACLALPLDHQPSCPERKNLPGDHSWRLGR